MTEEKSQQVKTIWQSCPHCQTKIRYSRTNPFRPFCSERCKNADFLGWSEEKHRIPENLPFSDLDAEFQNIDE